MKKWTFEDVTEPHRAGSRPSMRRKHNPPRPSLLNRSTPEECMPRCDRSFSQDDVVYKKPLYDSAISVSLSAMDRVAATPQEIASGSEDPTAAAPSAEADHLTTYSVVSASYRDHQDAMRGDCIATHGPACVLASSRASKAAAPCECVNPGRVNSGSLRSGRARTSLAGVHLSSVNRLHSVATGRSIHKKSSLARSVSVDAAIAYFQNALTISRVQIEELG